MNSKAKEVENTAIKLIQNLSLKKLCESFELTNTIDSDNISVVRGWLINELERRNSTKFEAWIMTDDVALMDNPSKFYL